MACSKARLQTLSKIGDAAASSPHPKKDDGNVQAEEKARECMEPIQFKLAEAMNPIPALGVPQQHAENEREVSDDHPAAGFGIELAMIETHIEFSLSKVVAISR
jgi:hypothetical protein